MPSSGTLAGVCLGLSLAIGGQHAAALRTKTDWQVPTTGFMEVHRDLQMNVVGLMPFTRLRVAGPMAINVITRTSATQPYLIRQPKDAAATWVTRTQISENESELSLEFPGPNFNPVVATIVVPKPIVALRASYQSNITVDYSGGEIVADTFGQIYVGKALLSSRVATPLIEVTSQSNITIGELFVEPDAAQVHFTAVSHGVVKVLNYNAPLAVNAITLHAANMGIVIIEGLWAPQCKELKVEAAEQGHVVTRRGISGRVELYSGTGSVANLGHTVAGDVHIFANSGSYAGVVSRGTKAYAQCNSGSLVRVAGAQQLERTATMGCHIYQPGEIEFDSSYCLVSGGRWNAACALAPLPPPHPGDGRMEGFQAPLGALQWLETGGHRNPETPEWEGALNLLVHKNAEFYTQVHNVINRYNWYWEQDVLKQQLAVSELVSGAPR